MIHLEFSKGFARLLAGVLCLVFACALMTPHWLGLELASSENGPLEWAQEVVLLAAAVFSGAAALNLRGPERMAAFLATLLYLVFLLRELELPPVGPVTQYLASETFRWHEAAVVAALVLPYVALRHRYWRSFLSYGLNGHGWPFVVAASFVGIGVALDGAPSLGGVAYLGTFLEETAELLGYVVLAVAAGWVLAGVRGEGATDAVRKLGAADAVGCGSRGS